MTTQTVVKAEGLNLTTSDSGDRNDELKVVHILPTFGDTSTQEAEMATSRIGRRLLVLLILLGSLAPAPGRAQTCGGI